MSEVVTYEMLRDLAIMIKESSSNQIIIIDNENGLLESEFGYIDTFTFIRQSRLPDITQCLTDFCINVVTEPEHNCKYMEGKILPKPVNNNFNQAPKQSFRQSMRSVNRNR